MLKLILLSGLLLRLILLGYGEYQDANFDLKYTDIDYTIFTDAARYVSQGLSPYNRATYRYTPLLAYMLVPSITMNFLFGKFVFVLCDFLAAWALNGLLKRRNVQRPWIFLAIWILNPFVAAISTRGSSESIMSALVLVSLLAFESGRLFIGSILFGLSVHFKIYPIIYVVPIWFFIDKERSSFITLRRIAFGIVSGSVFLGLGYYMYILYGQEFLNETYLYHLTRIDDRHNFSLYFYPLYLTKTEKSSVIMKLGAFFPQFLVFSFLGFKFAKKDLVYAVFLQTFAFVAFNKYFIWYLTYLPVVLARSRLLTTHKRRGVVLLIAWIAGQSLWLHYAYKLEFLGERTYLQLFISGCLFFLINVWALTVFSNTFIPVLQKSKKKTN